MKYCFSLFLFLILSVSFGQEYKYKAIALNFRDGKFDKALKMSEDAIGKEPNEMLPYIYKAMSIFEGREIEKITSKYPDVYVAAIGVLRSAKALAKPGDSIPQTFLVSLNNIQMQTVSLIRRALKKEDFATAIRLTEEHYLLFDHSHPLFESYAYPNLARFCGDQLVLKEIKKKDELFSYFLNTTKTYTNLAFKINDRVRSLYLLKKIQQSVNETSTALINKKQFDYVKKLDEYLLSVFDGSSEKKRNYYGYNLLFRKQEELKNAAAEAASLYKNTEDKLSDYVSAEYYFPEWDKPQYRMANTGKNCSYLTKKEKAVLYVMNLARIDPVLFEKTFLKKYLELNPEEVGQYSGSLRARLMKGQINMPILPDSVLFLAAEIHAKDFGEKGREGHGGLYNGPDGRAKHFGYIGEGVGECCDYGMELPEEMVLHLLVDSGVADLGHREALLSVEYVAVGISIQPHKEHGVNCVLDFTE